MKSRSKKMVGCGLALTSFLMLSAFSSDIPDIERDVDQQLTVVSSIVPGLINIEVSELIDSIEENKQEKLEAEKNSPWYNRTMAKVESSLNIRAAANIESEVVGVLYRGGAAEIIETGEEWTQIRSGEVEGYAKTEYLAFGEEAEEVALRDAGYVAVVNSDGLRLRKGPGTEEEVADVLLAGNRLAVEEELDEWIRVSSNGETYYVSSEYVEVELNVSTAKSMEEIQAEIARQEEEARAAEAARAAAAASTTSSAPSSSAAVSTGAAVTASYSDLALLAALIECEAGGESYEGKVAVGAVVLNRMRSASYPGTISEVIYQSGQFGPASSGKLATVLSRGANNSCVQAAQDALNGSNNVGSALYFGPASSGNGIVIGNHSFY